MINWNDAPEWATHRLVLDGDRYAWAELIKGSYYHAPGCGDMRWTYQMGSSVDYGWKVFDKRPIKHNGEI